MNIPLVDLKAQYKQEAERLLESLSSKMLNLCVIRLINMFNPVFRHMMCKSLWPDKSTNIPDSLEFTKKCIDKGVKWILVHQDFQPDGGVTSRVTFSMWRLIVGTSYPEVTGYIIPTLFNYASIFGSSQAFDAAVKAADFELPLQHLAGYFPGGAVGSLPHPSVFNSSQIVHGLVRAYKETNDIKYIESATKACHWICSVQDGDGAWGKFNYLGMKRVYDAKVCEALLETGNVIGSNDFLTSVNRNLDFVLRHQKDNGWFFNCDNSYKKNNAPLTHTIGYTIQGLLACYFLTLREDLLLAATKTLNVLMHRFELDKKLLPGRLFSNWKAASASSCVTGDAQISLCWMDMYRITEDFRYLNAALKMNDLLKKIQYNCSFKEIDGSLPASYPFWGDYGQCSVNSWGVKFYIDALIQEYLIKKKMIEEMAL